MKMMNILLYEFHIFELRDEAAYLTVMIFSAFISSFPQFK